MKRVLAFDIGIKNLAWCCGDLSGLADASGSVTVRGWANENLISGGTAEEDAVSGKCISCKAKATYQNGEQIFCVRHCPSLTPSLRDLSGNLLKKIPSLLVLKGLAAVSTKEKFKSKELVLTYLKTKFSLPLMKSVVKKVELADIHDGLRKVVLANRVLFASCSEILLENQPAFKNPVMKSVQMMLFATLRDILRPSEQGNPPKLRLVHAGRKTAGAKKGDEGYSDRKNASEERIVNGLTEGKIILVGRDSSWFGKQSKRSDLADCLCMVMDSNA
jgi:hypothetical protein